jgi:hypothetical protein
MTDPCFPLFSATSRLRVKPFSFYSRGGAEARRLGEHV